MKNAIECIVLSSENVSYMHNVEVGTFGSNIFNSRFENGDINSSIMWDLYGNSGIYDMFIEYTSQEQRSISVFKNDIMLIENLTLQSTGGWYIDNICVFHVGILTLGGIGESIRIRNSQISGYYGALPHIKSIILRKSRDLSDRQCAKIQESAQEISNIDDNELSTLLKYQNKILSKIFDLYGETPNISNFKSVSDLTRSLSNKITVDCDIFAIYNNLIGCAKLLIEYKASVSDVLFVITELEKCFTFATAGGHIEPAFASVMVSDFRYVVDKLIYYVSTNFSEENVPYAFIKYDECGVLFKKLDYINVDDTSCSMMLAKLFYMTRKKQIENSVFADALRLISSHCCFESEGTTYINVINGVNMPERMFQNLQSMNIRSYYKFTLLWWIDVNWPRQKTRWSEALLITIPLFVRELMKRGEAYLLLNSSTEISFFTPDLAIGLTRLANLIGCRESQLLYLPQNNYVVEDFARYVSCTHQYAAPKVVRLNTYPAMTRSSKLNFDDFVDRKKKIISFNNIPKDFRMALLIKMMRDGSLKDAHFSFNWDLKNAPIYESPITVDKLMPFFPECGETELDESFRQVKEMLPIYLDAVDRNAVDSQGRSSQLLTSSNNLALDAYFFVVTESEMQPRVSRFTEKCMKPLVNFNPFVIFGNKGTLKLLKEYGFKTFDNIFDESYDDIDDRYRRFLSAYNLVKSISDMELSEIRSIYISLKDTLVYNSNILDQMPELLVKELVGELGTLNA